MSPNKNPARDPVLDFIKAQDLAFDALAIAQKGLLRNPTKEEKRRLLRNIGNIKAELKQIGDQLDALADAEDVFEGPTDMQMEEVGKLTAEVAGLTNANLTARGSMEVTGKILKAVSSVADG